MRKLLFMKKVALACTVFAFSLNALAQAHQVSGVVTDETNQPVPGAAVMIKGSSTGTVTDMDGKFSIQANDGDVLVFSFIGYSNLEQTVSGNTINANLEPESVDLNDVVVIGYGTVKKSDLTGSVASVRQEDLKHRSTTDAAAALQGKVSGVQIMNTSGAPGKGAQIRVRGISSNAGESGPLLIVDGLKVDNIQYLDPTMIEKMEVLKDAASAAIYGAQAGNGVVLITTKSGANKGEGTITYEGKFTMQSLGKKAELFDTKGYIDYQKYIGNLTDLLLNDWDGKDHDWFDEVFETSWAKQHSLTFQGGNDRGHFLASVNYVTNDGIVKGLKDTYERLTTQVNADYKIKKWLSISTNNSIEKWSSKSVSEASYGSMLNSVMSIDPLTPAYYSKIEDCATAMQQHEAMGDPVRRDPNHNNDYYATSKFLEESTGNPLFQRDKTDASNGGFTLRGMTSVNFMPVDFITLTSRLGYRIAQSNSHSYEEPYWLTGMASSANYSISTDANNSYYYQFENFLNFNKTFADVHTVNAMVGMGYEENRSDNAHIGASGTNILSSYASNFRYINYLLPDVDPDVNNAPSKSANMSYYGRLMYSFDNKYSVQANFRADAYDSSKLDKSSRWGKFPSVSAGWTVSNESFIKDNISEDILSYFKLRGSWGRNGNVNILNGYQYSTTVSLNSQWYQYNVDSKDQTMGSAPDGLANPDLKWETHEQIDFGFDSRFLNSRLSFGFDWFKKTTKDLIFQYAPSPEIGVKNTYVNAGEVENKGIEFEIGWKDQIGDFHYSVNANLSSVKNTVKELFPAFDHLDGTVGGVSGLNYKVRTRFEANQPLWYFYSWEYAGVNKETGAAQYYDKDGKITETPTDNDMKKIGSAIPDATYGITINMEYKGFDFTVYGAGSIGNDIFSLLYSADRSRTNCLKEFYENSWKQPGDNAKYPDMKKVATGNWTFWSSSASIFNGSYFKFKQIQLGYTIPSDITNKIFVNNCRVFVSLDDFFTITKYKGCDPETVTTGKDMGYDCGTYPTSKKVVFGVSLSF